MSEHKKTKKISGKLVSLSVVIASVVFIMAVAGCVIGATIFEIKHQNVIYPGITIGDINVGGMTQEQASAILENKKEEIIKTGLVFAYKENKIIIPAVLPATDPDLARPIFSFDISKSVAEAYQSGRGRSWLDDSLMRFIIWINGRRVQLVFDFNQKELADALKASFGKYEQRPQDAELYFSQSGEAVVISEKSGSAFNYDSAVAKARLQLATLKNEPIAMEIASQLPAIYKEETGSALELAKAAASTSTPLFWYKAKTWQISKEEMRSWLEFYRDNQIGPVLVRFRPASTTEYLKKIAQEIDIEAHDAKFAIEDNRVTEFQSNVSGQRVNVGASADRLNSEFFKRGNHTIELSVEVAEPKVKIGDLNNLGIKELLGVGTSNFKGSPKNRRHNISVGAKSLNGILIKPNEEFSLLKALGPVDGEHDYLQELVIKGDRTVPEFGGGLCQIGTTTFRAALYSGLPITMRRNHTYRVVYYEPAGMDATIYDPAPDLKFINDTKYHILFTTRIEGDELFFEFYGTADGRTVDILPDPPKIFNITSPGEPKYVETEEIPVGEKRLVEHSHNGADTSFDYKVTYSDGTVKENNFSSHYVAWPEVWLVGVEKVATSTDGTVPAEGAAAPAEAILP